MSSATRPIPELKLTRSKCPGFARPTGKKDVRPIRSKRESENQAVFASDDWPSSALGHRHNSRSAENFPGPRRLHIPRPFRRLSSKISFFRPEVSNCFRVLQGKAEPCAIGSHNIISKKNVEIQDAQNENRPTCPAIAPERQGQSCNQCP